MKNLKKFESFIKGRKKIDWSIYDEYEYSEGDGVYLDEESLYKGIIKTTNRESPFVNIKHPKGKHIIASAVHDQNRKDLFKNRCRMCGEYKMFVSTEHAGIETIPLCKSCYEDDYE